MRKFFDKYGGILLSFVCTLLFCIGLFSKLFWWLWLVSVVCVVMFLLYKPRPRKLSYKDAALYYPDMAENGENIVKSKAEVDQAGENFLRRYHASEELMYRIVKDGDPEYDTIPEHELIQQHASESGKTIETEDQYLLWALRMVKTKQKSIYEFRDRKVNSILRRRLGIPSSIIEFKKCLALKDPFVAYAWKERGNRND